MSLDVHRIDPVERAFAQEAGQDRELAGRLARAYRTGTVAIVADMKRLQHIHSPVLSQADGNQWLLAIALILAGAWWKLGWVSAAAGLVPGVAVYATVGQRTIRRRMLARIGRRLDDAAAWRKLWEFGGIVLEEGSTGRRCAAPEGDWRAFVRGLATADPGPGATA